jgi:hypothetical protein
LARWTQAVSLAIVAWKSFARRRLRPSQAKLRSTTLLSLSKGPRQELEAFDAGGPLDNLDCPGSTIGNRIAQLLAAIDPVGEDVAQLRKAAAQVAQQRHGAMRVLDVGRVHPQGEHKALRIGDDMALAPLDALARVNPTRATAFGGRHALAVNDPGRWRPGMAPRRVPAAGGRAPPAPD